LAGWWTDHGRIRSGDDRRNLAHRPLESSRHQRDGSDCHPDRCRRRLDRNARAFEAEPPASSVAGGAVAVMKSLTMEEPDNLFPARRDAVLYLIGLGGFWGGVVVFSGLAIACAFLHMSTTRKFEGRLTGRPVRPWPFGYASFRTQVIATLPSTVMAAAQRLKWNAIVVTAATYSMLVIGLIALIAWPTTR